MTKESGNIGIYIHVPFCLSKCRYCDFYSIAGADDMLLDSYTDAVCRDIKAWHEEFGGRADTIYFGGGTPSLLGARRIADIIDCAVRIYNIDLASAEITVEANPDTVTDMLAAGLSSGGVNRLSLGMQSADLRQLELLGRRHTPERAERAVESALCAGIDNISVDIMLGIMEQDVKSAVVTAEFAASLGVKHISAYMLKVEKGTPLYNEREKYNIPGDDEVCDIYLNVCDRLNEHGLLQYEISNFALPGFECRHNLKYWKLEPYIGIGPAAHSYIGKGRFYYPRNLDAFLKNGHEALKLEERCAGDIEEYVMLHLRLREGIHISELIRIYGEQTAGHICDRAEKLSKEGLLHILNDRIYLDRRGFLVSNSIIAYLLYE